MQMSQSPQLSQLSIGSAILPPSFPFLFYTSQLERVLLKSLLIKEGRWGMRERME